MALSKLFSVFLLTLAFAIASLSQDSVETAAVTDDLKPKVTTKVDEFGKAGDCDLSARIDNLFTQLNANPDATGYVITYNGLDFLPSDYDSSPMRGRILRAIAFRKYDPSRLVLIDGGFRETVSTELFLVPPDGTAPTPTDTVPKPKMPKRQTFLWGKISLGGSEEDVDFLDEFILPDVKAKQDAEMRENSADVDEEPAEKTDAVAESETVTDEQSAESVEPELTPEELQALRFSWADDRFGAEVTRRKKASGVLIFYADDQYYDINKLRYFIEEGKERISNKAKIDVSRIQVIFGGYRDYPQGEFWMVPANAEFPLATPDERPVDVPQPDSQ